MISKFRSEIITNLNRELSLHPQSSLIDIYKLFYQDYFGPGHYISHREKVVQDLEAELEDCKNELDNHPLQETGCFNDFLRVDIRSIKMEFITREKLAELFYQSSKIVLYQPVFWYEHWMQICRIISELELDISLQGKNELIDYAGKCRGVHHSEQYRKLYSPHYRIISHDLWKNS